MSFSFESTESDTRPMSMIIMPETIKYVAQAQVISKIFPLSLSANIANSGPSIPSPRYQRFAPYRSIFVSRLITFQLYYKMLALSLSSLLIATPPIQPILAFQPLTWRFNQDFTYPYITINIY